MCLINGSFAAARRHLQRLIAVVALVGLLLPAMPAWAIVGSTTAGAAKYPYVGGIWITDPGFDVPPQRVRANGILVAPNIVLTEAGSYRNGRQVAVSFENPITDFQDDPGDAVYRGYVYHHPGADFETPSGFFALDLAVIILDEDVVGVDPVPLADRGALDNLIAQKKKGDEELTVVGYGPATPNTKHGDFQRRTSSWTFTGLTDTTVRLERAGLSACDGDQGSSIVNESGVVALLMNWPEMCHANNVVYGYRLDTQETPDFLCDVGREPLVTVGDPDDPNWPFDEQPPTTFVTYPAITEASLAVLDDYCHSGDVRAASAKDGDKHRKAHGHKQHQHHKRRHRH